MAVRKILTIPDPVLYQKAEPVAKFDRKLRGLARDMFETMYEASGVGLAAVQIGVLQRLLVIDLEDQGF
ncbi:MAG: peptide deformylase, partial [Leptospiraceae bacterium]|nr:peptide deformylase [Leptospiraceae bacterium]